MSLQIRHNLQYIFSQKRFFRHWKVSIIFCVSCPRKLLKSIEIFFLRKWSVKRSKYHAENVIHQHSARICICEGRDRFQVGTTDGSISLDNLSFRFYSSSFDNNVFFHHTWTVNNRFKLINVFFFVFLIVKLIEGWQGRDIGSID